MDEVQRYHQTLRKVWRSCEPPAQALPGMRQMPYYGQRPTCETPKLLFLGLNPSFRLPVLEGHWTDCFGTGGPPFRANDLYWLSSRTDAHLDVLEPVLEQLDHYSRTHYPPYYGVLQGIAHTLGASTCWHALDVFPMRVTVQAELVKALPGNVPLPGPAGQLFEAFQALLLSFQPQLVLVVNAFASRMLAAQLPLTRTGVGSRYSWPQLPGTTFLLSGMLSGGRALDEFSRERLVAEARTVWKELGNGS